MSAPDTRAQRTKDALRETTLRFRRRRVHHLPPLSPFARLALLFLGWFLLLLGIAGLVLPGLQGIVTILAGSAVLSLVSPTVLLGLRWLFRPWPKGWRRLLRLRKRVHGWVTGERSVVPAMAVGEPSPGGAGAAGKRNLWAVSLTSFFTDISSEMVLRLVPLYLAGVLGVRVHVIGLIEGVAGSTASLLKVFSGRLSDRLGSRKWLAVLGYGISALAKPFFLIASSWGAVAAVRWADRVGKGVRTAPRDALLAESIEPRRRGFAFGLHRAADTAGAFLGLAISLAVVWWVQGRGGDLDGDTFFTIVWLSLVPAFLAVVILAVGAREVSRSSSSRPSSRGPVSSHPNSQEGRLGWRYLGRPFLRFLLIAALFDLGNSSDAFVVLRASERGLGVVAILAMLMTFNLVYALCSMPAGTLSDRVGRRKILAAGWLLYGAVYLGLGLAKEGWQIWTLAAFYGLYYGLTHGTARALVADLVPSRLRGTAFGTYHAVLGVLDLPASVIAGVLWHGLGDWHGLGPSAPFYFGAALAVVAALLLLWWWPRDETSGEVV